MKNRSQHRGEMHEEMETEGKLQTMCICEEREYLSLSSWMGGERGAGEGEWSRWRGEEVKRMKEDRERCKRSMKQMDEDDNCQSREFMFIFQPSKRLLSQ